MVRLDCFAKPAVCVHPPLLEDFVHTCFRAVNRVQNRAIMRYALFVVWKLYTCRFATQQTDHFSFRSSLIDNQRFIGEKCLFLRDKNRQLVYISATSCLKQAVFVNQLSELRKVKKGAITDCRIKYGNYIL